MKSHSFLVLGMCILAGTLFACAPQPDVQVAQSLGEAVGQTATAGDDTPANPPAAVGTAEAAATQLAADIETTRAAAEAAAGEGEDATATAIAPVLADLPTYGIDPAAGSPAWLHPPLTLETEGYLQYDYANHFMATLASDFVLSADITWDTTTGLAGCGFVLRADGDEEAPNHYLALASRGGNGSVVFMKQVMGAFAYTEVVSTGPFDPAFDWQNETTNRLTVVGRGDTFTFYTNGSQVAEFTDGDYGRGLVAMVALSESGQTHCEFDNAWLWLFDDGS